MQRKQNYKKIEGRSKESVRPSLVDQPVTTNASSTLPFQKSAPIDIQKTASNANNANARMPYPRSEKVYVPKQSPKLESPITDNKLTYYQPSPNKSGHKIRNSLSNNSLLTPPNQQPHGILRSRDSLANKKPERALTFADLNETERSNNKLSNHRSRSWTTDGAEKQGQPSLSSSGYLMQTTKSPQSTGFDSSKERGSNRPTNFNQSRARSRSFDQSRSSAIAPRFYGFYRTNSIELFEYIKEHEQFRRFLGVYRGKRESNAGNLPWPSDIESLGNVYLDIKPHQPTYLFNENPEIVEIAQEFMAGFTNSKENRQLLDEQIIKKANGATTPGTVSPATIAFHLIKLNGSKYITVSTSWNNHMGPVRDALAKYIDELNSQQSIATKYILVCGGSTLNYSSLIAKIRGKLDGEIPSVNEQTCQEKFSGSFFLKLWLTFGSSLQILSAANCDLFVYNNKLIYGESTTAEPNSAAYHVKPPISGSNYFNLSNGYVCLKPCCEKCREDKPATLIIFKRAQTYGDLTKNKKEEELERMRSSLRSKPNSGNFFEPNEEKNKTPNTTLATSPLGNSIYGLATLRDHPIFSSTQADKNGKKPNTTKASQSQGNELATQQLKT